MASKVPPKKEKKKPKKVKPQSGSSKDSISAILKK